MSRGRGIVGKVLLGVEPPLVLPILGWALLMGFVLLDQPSDGVPQISPHSHALDLKTAAGPPAADHHTGPALTSSAAN